MRKRLAALAALCTIHGPWIPAAAAASASIQLLSQSGHSIWRTQEGSFTSPNSIAQTKEGYLWIATTSGLVRFDGARFVSSNVFPEGSIADWRLTTLFAASDGSLWIGATGRVARLKDGHLARHDIPGTAKQFVEDARGTVWFVRTGSLSGSGPLCNVADGKVQCHGAPDIPLAYASVLRTSEEGSFWIGSSGALCRWTPGRTADCFLQEKLKPLDGLDGVSAVLAARDRTVWVGMAKPGKEFGLGQLEGGRWKPFAVQGFDGSALTVSAMLEDRHGSLWVGTSDQGIYRIHAGRAEHFGAENGLTGNTVSANGLLEDREGTVWVATSAGLDAFRSLPVSVISTREGLVADSVESILPARDGTVWIGNLSLSTLIDDRPASPPMATFVGAKSVTSLLQDHAGRIWIGLENALYVFENGALKPVTRSDGGPLGIVEQLSEDASHDVWAKTVGRPSPLFRIRDLVVVEELAQRVGNPFALVPDPTAGMWFTYVDGSIAHYNDDALKTFSADAISSGRPNDGVAASNASMLMATTRGLLVQSESSRLLLDSKHGMPCDGLNAIVRDARGNYWISARCGLIGITAAELERWRTHPETRIQTRFLDVTDGFQPGRGSFVPAARLGADGRLWFANGKIAQVVDPEALAGRSSPPPVLIEEVTADRVAYGVGESVRLPPKPRDIDIRFTALSFVVPQKIRFQYRLEGRDPDWREAGAARQAFYTDLPPGHYRFRVKAGNSEGVWNETGASMAIEIPPLFYQTRWFLVLAAAAVAATLYVLYVARVREVAARVSDRLAVKHAERERIARDLHDTLLQGTQGLIFSVQAAANRVAAGEPARHMLEQALERADAVMAEGRERIQDLRVSADVGIDLYASLSFVGEELAKDCAVDFTASVEGAIRRLTPEVRDEVYQIGRQALLNAFQHAKAASIEMQIIYGDDDLRVRIRDDGVGIDLASPDAGERPGHWGLKGMRERALAIGAQLEVWSRLEAGTEIEIKVEATRAYVVPVSRPRWSWLRRLASQGR